MYNPNNFNFCHGNTPGTPNCNNNGGTNVNASAGASGITGENNTSNNAGGSSTSGRGQSIWDIFLGWLSRL